MLTKKDLVAIGQIVEQSLKNFRKVVKKDITDSLGDFFMDTLVQYFDEHIEDRFDKMDKRFDGVDKRFTEVDKRFDNIDQKLEKIDKKVDYQRKRIENLESQRPLS